MNANIVIYHCANQSFLFADISLAHAHWRTKIGSTTQASLQKHLFLMLSCISLALGESASAFAYAQDARYVADQTTDTVGVADALRMRAEIALHTGQLPEARTSCQQALALFPGDEHQQLRATTLLLLGQIAEEEWRGQPEQETLAEEAQERYEQAQVLFKTQQNGASLANVSLHLATLLEARGQPEQALSYWKHAYTLSTPRVSQTLSSGVIV